MRSKHPHLPIASGVSRASLTGSRACFEKQLLLSTLQCQCGCLRTGSGGSAWDSWLEGAFQSALAAAPLDMAEAWATAVRFAVNALAHTNPAGMHAVLQVIIQQPPQGKLLCRDAEGVCLSVCVCVCVCVYVCLCASVCICVCVYRGGVCLCVCVCLSVCLSVCLCVCRRHRLDWTILGCMLLKLLFCRMCIIKLAPHVMHRQGDCLVVQLHLLHHLFWDMTQHAQCSFVHPICLVATDERCACSLQEHPLQPW